MNFSSHLVRDLFEKCLYDHGMAERTGWVQPPQTLLCVEIEPQTIGSATVLEKQYIMLFFWKILGMAWPGVENVPTPRGSIFCVSRGSQLPYNEQIKNSDFCLYIYIYI